MRALAAITVIVVVATAFGCSLFLDTDGLSGPGDDASIATDVDAQAQLADTSAPDVVIDANPPRDATLAQIGCADGTREAFIDLAKYADIAGCSGGFQVAGLTSAASTQPQCGRAAGNSGANPTGVGCSIEDFCAVGWHVCRSASEVAAAAPGGCNVEGEGIAIWIARQSLNNGVCGAGGFDNVVGCATSGTALGAPASCAPLGSMLDIDRCPAPWYCGGAAQKDSEADWIRKPAAVGGGALCCRAN